MGTFTEPVRPYEFLHSEGPGTISRDAVTIASGAGVLAAGTVLAKLSASGKYVAYDNAGTDGSETAAAVLTHGVDATSADVVANAITRLAEVKVTGLQWAAGLLQADKDAAAVDLAAKYIIVRPA